PTAATLKRSLGAVWPRPSTWRGTIANPAVVAATLPTNWRLEILAIIHVSTRLDEAISAQMRHPAPKTSGQHAVSMRPQLVGVVFAVLRIRELPPASRTSDTP